MFSLPTILISLHSSKHSQVEKHKSIFKYRMQSLMVVWIFKMHMIKVSNIMGIDPKPFDPKTYVEEDVYVTDESGSKKRIRLENNIVRWRRVKNPDGTTSVSQSFGFSSGHLRCEVEGQGEAGIESEGEPLDVDVLHGESEGEKSQSSQEVEIGDQREESEERYLESDDEGYGQRVVTSRRRNTIDSGSERSGENYFIASKDEEVNQARSYSRSPDDDKNEDHLLHSAPEIRDVFGDSDDEEQEEYAVQNQIEDENRSPVDEEETFEKELRPEDMILDEDAPYESDEEHAEARPKEKPVGPPLELEIPLRRPPADPDKVYLQFCDIYSLPL
ncbi:protein LEO1 homolog [Olea europaea var. sylvestris]|uniref:protein LEO1 homolog n=1 Tax=Olea europaea var. sylvestris TaxID=158386 RepID=UPI000C1D6DE8|nr:protein LEO1 homolog [Olea europaea var. sylvestris]